MQEETAFTIGAMALVVYALYLRFRRRELQHKERLAAIEKGVALPDLTDIEASPRIYLLRGMMWLFGGIFLVIALLAISATTRFPKTVQERYQEAESIQRRGGTAEQILAAQNDTGPLVRVPLAFSLIGLVPVGVGMAYLIFYRVETARPR